MKSSYWTITHWFSLIRGHEKELLTQENLIMELENWVRREQHNNGAQRVADPRGGAGGTQGFCVRASGRGGTDGRSDAGERKGRGRASGLCG